MIDDIKHPLKGSSPALVNFFSLFIQIYLKSVPSQFPLWFIPWYPLKVFKHFSTINQIILQMDLCPPKTKEIHIGMNTNDLNVFLIVPNPAKPAKGHFWGKFQHCWKLVLSPLQMGQNYYLARIKVHAISDEYEDRRKCMVHFEDKGTFPKVHWWILEDSGMSLARIPRGLGLMK